MPIDYRIDHRRRLVIARGVGRVEANDGFAYLRGAWADAAVAGYDEIIDLSGASSVEVPELARVHELAALAASLDAPGVPSKSVIIASDNLTNALARVYEACRALEERSTKEVRVFQSSAEALNWLGLDPGGADDPLAPPQP